MTDTDPILAGIEELQVFLERLRGTIQDANGRETGDQNGRGLQEAEHGLYMLSNKATVLACKARDIYYPELLRTLAVIPVEVG